MKTIYQMSCAPELQLVSDFMTSQECKALIRCASARMEPSEVLAPDGNAFDNVRSSTGMFFGRGELPLVEQLEARLSGFFGFPAENGEGLQILRYKEGQEYKPHFDYFDPATFSGGQALRRGQRVATILMYLNTPVGGATVFPEFSAKVLPLEGMAVCFRYSDKATAYKSQHGSQPVEAGEKWVATKWVREGRF